MIPYGRQSINQEDIAAVVAVLESDWLTQGPAVPRFEQLMVAHTGAGDAVALNSATSALHVAMLALGVGPGDLVWTSPITFVASANCALYCGAEIDFVDIDAETQNMSIATLANRLAAAREHGERLPKVVVPVHFAGLPCDMLEIGKLADEYGFHVVEDASHAIGATYHGEPIGNCRHSDFTIFSFHPVKIITTAEGGLLTARDPYLARQAALLRSHGITRDPEQMGASVPGAWYYEQIALGFNYRMTDLQAALGASQLHRLDEFIARRTYLADRYDRLLGDLPVDLPARRVDRKSAWHLYVIRLQPDARRRAEVFAELRSRGVGVNVHYIPVPWQPYYVDLGFRRGQFPNAESYYEAAISLPLYFGLTEAEQDYVAASLSASLQ